MSKSLAINKNAPTPFIAKPSIVLSKMQSDLNQSWGLAWLLFSRKIVGQNRQTILGYLWLLIPLLFSTLTFVFLNNNKIINVTEISIPYLPYALIGMTLWQLFSDALLNPVRIVPQYKSLLSKIQFPREALILSGLLDVYFNFCIRLCLLVPVALYFDLSLFTPSLLLTLFGVIAISLLGTTLGLCLTPFAVLFQDIEKGLPLILTACMFLTPVFYPIPSSKAGELINAINPMSSLLNDTRNILIQESTFFSLSSLIFIGLTFFFIGLSWLFYRIAMPHLIARVPN